ncbi:MAG: M56 family metallopeptidase, partial [Planctomycetota bacterium]|nr:M56 family metallopeptidase [Planctomycetota bacterium]
MSLSSGAALLSALGAAWLPVLVDAAVKGTVVLVVALVVSLLARRASAAARHLVWFLALVGLLGLPALSVALPGWQVLPGWIDLTPATVSESPGAARAAPSAGSAALQDADDSPWPSGVAPSLRGAPLAGSSEVAPGRSSAMARGVLPAPVARAAPLWSAARVRIWILPLWAAGAAAALTPVLLGMISLWRLGRGSRRVTDGSWAVLLERLSAALGLKRPVMLLQSGHRSMPMAWGLVRPKLLIPDEAGGWSLECLRSVLLHELAHIRRWDCLTQLVARVACGLYWFNPLAWLALHRMVAEHERACDDVVLAAGGRAPEYAEHLLEVASRLPAVRFSLGVGIALARPSRLEGRLLAILDGQRSRRAVTRWGALAAAVLVAGIVVPLACLKATGDKPASAPESPATPGSVLTGFGEELDWEAYFRRITGTETPQDREKRAAREKQAFEDAIRKTAPTTSTVPATHQPAAPPAVSIGFGPVVERVVRVPSARNDTFLDLETGKLLAYEDSNGPDEPTMSKELSQIYRRARWARASGADLCLPPDGRFDKEVTGLTGLDMRMLPTEVPFDRLTPQGVAEALADRDFNMWNEMRRLVGKLPATFLVETREGHVAVVQVAALADPPPGLKVRYRIAAAPLTVPEAPLWITLAPSEESVKSLKDLRVVAEVRNLDQEAGRSGEWEIRTADNTRRIAWLPYNWHLYPDELLPDGKRIVGGTNRKGLFRLDESQLRRVGAMEKGDYLLAWHVGGQRCSNVMRFRIDADHHPNALPLLELAEVETGPGRRLPVLVLRARRHAENDPAPRNSDVAFATLNVDGQDRTLSGMGWAGPNEPMRVGEHYTYLLDLRWWTWDPQLKLPAAPIDLDKPHVIFAKVGRDGVQQTPPIRLTYARALGEAWDLATAKLAPVPSPEASISLSGAVVDLQGQPGRNYEVTLVSGNGARFRENADGAGKYRFLRIPPGTYNLGCYPPGAGRPSLVMNGITIRADETVQVNLSFHRKFIMTGVVTYADGKPGSNIDVELGSKDPQSGAEFEDIVTTDEQGRYTLASPLGSVTYVMVNHARAGQPDPQLQAGQNRVSYTLRMQNGRFVAFPTPPPAAPATSGKAATPQPTTATPPAEEASRATPVWVAILPRSPILSVREYRHTLRVVDPAPEPPLYKPAPIPACDFEIRRADVDRSVKGQARVARIPYLDYFRKNGEPNESDRRRIGDLPDGEYFVALVIGQARCSNVASLEIRASYNPRNERPLRLEVVEPGPGQKLPRIGMRGTGPTPEDPKFGTWAVHLPDLIVDGVKQHVKQIFGSFFPMGP